MTPEITNSLYRCAHSVVISGHVTRHVVDFSNYTDFRVELVPGVPYLHKATTDAIMLSLGRVELGARA